MLSTGTARRRVGEVSIVTVITPFEVLTVRDGDVLILRFDPATTRVEKQELAQQAAQTIEGTAGARVTVVVMEESMTIEALDENEMRKFGWVRIRPDAGG